MWDEKYDNNNESEMSGIAASSSEEDISKIGSSFASGERTSDTIAPYTSADRSPDSGSAFTGAGSAADAGSSFTSAGSSPDSGSAFTGAGSASDTGFAFTSAGNIPETGSSFTNAGSSSGTGSSFTRTGSASGTENQKAVVPGDYNGSNGAYGNGYSQSGRGRSSFAGFYPSDSTSQVNRGNGYSAASGSAGGNGGPDVLYSGGQKQNGTAAGNSDTGHYYDYSRNSSRYVAAGGNGGNGNGGNGNGGGNAGGNVRRNAGNGSGGRKKNNGRVALILAVVLVFLLGAGAGAYVSGRGTTATVTSGSSASSGKEKGSVQTEKKEEEQKSTKSAAEKADVSTDPAESIVNTEPATISKVEAIDSLTADANTVVADVAERVMPSIVSVYNKYTEKGQFFGQTYTQESEAAGSGIIIGESDGELLIVTNNHVVEGADSLSVQFIDEENCEAALKGTDPGSDLAVIAVKVSDLSAETRNKIAIADLGDSDALRIGEQVIAIGNALGYGQSLTVGYVSALNREFSDEEDGITGTFIQTDAAINPGNSGGALLDSSGQVIGINSNKIGGDAIEGMGFAIPISKAIPIIDNLKQQESKTKVQEEERGVLGIYGISVTSDVASAYGLPVGAYVEEIIEGTGAANSELQQGDIITAFEGVDVTSMESLSSQLAYYTAGQEVTLTIQHPIEGGEYEEKEITLTLSKASDIQSQESNGRSGGWEEEQEQEQEIPYDQDTNLFGFPFGSFGF